MIRSFVHDSLRRAAESGREVSRRMRLSHGPPTHTMPVHMTST